MKYFAATSALAATGAGLSSSAAAQPVAGAPTGRYRHSACRWCYPKLSLDDLCVAGKEIGLASIELLTVEELPTLAKYDLKCAMVFGVPGGITHGLNRREHHDAIVAFMEKAIPATADAGHPAVICFSGNREGQSDEEGLEICAEGLARLTPIAEKYGVNLSMELLNSKVNHPDYQCDNSAWGVALCEKVGSPRFGLLYDIYHMQIMEGDLIRTIRDHHQWFNHYHTGGNPGRNELDGLYQEINYPAVMRALAEVGYAGYVGQEFVPAEDDPLASLRRAVALCSV